METANYAELKRSSGRIVGNPEVILGRALPGGLYEVSERKTTVFRSQKLCVLSCYLVAFCVAFLTRGFPFFPGALHGPARSPTIGFAVICRRLFPYPFNSSVITLRSSPAS